MKQLFADDTALCKSVTQNSIQSPVSITQGHVIVDVKLWPFKTSSGSNEDRTEILPANLSTNWKKRYWIFRLSSKSWCQFRPKTFPRKIRPIRYMSVHVYWEAGIAQLLRNNWAHTHTFYKTVYIWSFIQQPFSKSWAILTDWKWLQNIMETWAKTRSL